MTRRILGIDPGLNFTGWAVVESDNAVSLNHIAHGVISPTTSQPMESRLAHLHQAIGEVISHHKPSEAAIEETFANSNAQSTMKLREARGALLAALGGASLAVGSFAPNKVKKAVSGQGHAPKDQVARMVGMLLGIPDPKSEDAADALAVAICGIYNSNGIRG